MQKSAWSVGHSKHRKAFGKKRQKSARLRLWLKMRAERFSDRRARPNPTMAESIKELFSARPTNSGGRRAR